MTILFLVAHLQFLPIMCMLFAVPLPHLELTCQSPCRGRRWVIWNAADTLRGPQPMARKIRQEHLIDLGKSIGDAHEELSTFCP